MLQFRNDLIDIAFCVRNDIIHIHYVILSVMSKTNVVEISKWFNLMLNYSLIAPNRLSRLWNSSKALCNSSLLNAGQ